MFLLAAWEACVVSCKAFLRDIKWRKVLEMCTVALVSLLTQFCAVL